VSGRRWTTEEEDELIEAIGTFGPYDLDRIGEVIGRTPAAVQQRLSKGSAKLKAKVRDAAKKFRILYEAGVPTPATNPADTELLKAERRITQLTDENRDLHAKVKALHKRDGLFDQLAGVIQQVVTPLPSVTVPPVPKGAPDRTPCDFVLILSDEHADEVVSRESTWGIEQFDWHIFRCRLERLRNLIADYARLHLPMHKPERLWVLKLGDAVNGDIHGAGPRNFFGNTIKAAIAVGDTEAQFVQSLIPFFPGGVHVVGVSGNHPRRSTHKDYDAPHDNFDYLVGVQMAARLANEVQAGRCSVVLPEAWSAYVQIRNSLWCLAHGDDTTSYTGLPWVGFDRRNNRVQSLLRRVARHADVFAYGHYHTPAAFPSGGGLSFHSGCWTAAESYAINKLAAGGEPQQHLIVVGDKPGVRSILLPIPLYTRDEAQEEAFRNGKWAPTLGAVTPMDLLAPKPMDGLHVVAG